MTDLGDTYQDMTDAKKERHAEWHKQNMEIMSQSGIYCVAHNNEECLTTPLNASFYPSTGRWAYKGRTFRGVGQGRS